MPGSKASEEVALQRSRGRLPAFFVSRFSKQASGKMVPPYLRVEVDFVDDYLDQQREIIADIRARNLQRLVTVGVMTPEAARARLYQDKYISDSIRLNMSLADGFLTDGTQVLRVLADPNYDDILLVNRDYLMGNADREQALNDIQANLIHIWGLMAATAATFKHERYKIAMAALDQLRKMYEAPPAAPAEPVAIADGQEKNPVEPRPEDEEEQPAEDRPEEEAAEKV